MATIGASLKLFDQFSGTLTQAQQKMQGTILLANQLKSAVQGNINLHIVLNSAQIMTQVAALRTNIQSQIGHIIARIQLELPASLTVMFTNLQRLLLKFIAAAKRFTTEGASNGQQLQTALQRIAQLEQQILNLQDKINNGSQKGASSSGGLLSSLSGIVSGLRSIPVGKAIQISDEYMSTQAKIKLANDGKQSPQELQNSIFAAANRSRGDYGTMAGNVIKLGQTAGGSFGSSKEMVSFAELMQKSLKIGGASSEEQQTGMSQATKAMSSGKVGGEDMLAMMESAPVLASAVAKFVGKSTVDLKKMAEEGKITSNVIKGALFKAADDINSRFQKVPKTFGDVFTLLKNHALQSFGPIIERVSTLLNSPAGDTLFQAVTSGISVAANAFSIILTVAQSFFGFIQDHWPIIRAGLLALAVVIAGELVGSILAMGAAWLVANWPILLVVAAIALIIFVLQQCGVSANQVIGFMAGAFMYLVGSVWNSVALIWNIFSSLSDFLINLFVEPTYAMERLIYDLAMTYGSYMLNMMQTGEDFAGSFMKNILHAINKALEGFNWLVDKVNGIFGTDFKQAKLFDESNVHAVSDGLKNVLSTMEEPVSNKVTAKAPRMGLKNLKNEFDYGYKAGSGLVDSLGSFSSFSDLMGNKNGDMTNSTLGKVKEVGAINDTVDISSEDLKLMRDVAERESIKNFITLTPTVEVGDVHINDGTDADELLRRITQAVEVEVTNHAQGVY
ncbi:tape measure protein [Paenibacillus alba]|uniref:tape measure protein n=1 Tax=Paenibacillus alba TaxID=1197127 RepID=UPI001563C41D|nr:tape measure protein [Paenibacillus alba]NQX68067.1 tape measure protein [Paenibacillus alba]